MDEDLSTSLLRLAIVVVVEVAMAAEVTTDVGRWPASSSSSRVKSIIGVL